MNFFAHGRPFLDRPYLLAGTAIPDWLNVVDRKVRARRKAAVAWLDHADSRIADIAGGIVQHHVDDAWFHQTRAFSDLSLDFTVRLRDRFPDDHGFRPSFLGHILVEILLDSVLAEDAPKELDAYYRAVESVDGDVVVEVVEGVSGRSVPDLPRWIERFCRDRFLYDYQEDAKLLWRLNRVLERVRLTPLPPAAVELLAPAREDVRRNRNALLTPPSPADPTISPGRNNE